MASEGPGFDVGTRPFRWLPTDERSEPTDGVGLCLSGGGYRAMLFHVGVLWRLNELGWLQRLTRVSSVSGGSITAAALGQAWNRLEFQAGQPAAGFLDLVVAPLRELARHTIDAWAIGIGLLSPDTIGERVAHAYAEHLFAARTLQDLPDEPRFVLNATNLGSGALFRFSKPYLADWRVGQVANPTTPLADAVAASSAFPPVLSPFELDLRRAAWDTVEGNELTGEDFRGKLALADGGVYDNLGIETAWKRCQTVLVSDAGGKLTDEPDPPHDWARQSMRVLKVVDNQVRALRKRQIQAAYRADIGDGGRHGAYWGIRSDIANFELADALPCPPERTVLLAKLATRLKGWDEVTHERLINWGYAVSDAALRKWVERGAPPQDFPYPEAGV